MNFTQAELGQLAGACAIALDIFHKGNDHERAGAMKTLLRRLAEEAATTHPDIKADQLLARWELAYSRIYGFGSSALC